MRVELSDGGWADVRDPRKVTARQTEPLEDAQFELMGSGAAAHLSDEAAAAAFEKLSPGAQMQQIGPAGMRAFRAVQRATVLTYVSAWSYGPTITADALLDDVPAPVLTELASRIGDVVKATGGPKVNVEPSVAPDSPS